MHYVIIVQINVISFASFLCPLMGFAPIVDKERNQMANAKRFHQQSEGIK
jgi:hypothetical protein